MELLTPYQNYDEISELLLYVIILQVLKKKND